MSIRNELLEEIRDLIAAGGGSSPAFSDLDYAVFSSSAALTLADTVYGKIPLSQRLGDGSLGSIATSDFVVPDDGWYECTGYVAHDGNNTNGHRRGFISVDNSTAYPPTALEGGLQSSGSAPPIEGVDNQPSSTVLKLTAGQTVSLYGWQNSGGNLDVLAGSWLCIKKLGAVNGGDAWPSDKYPANGKAFIVLQSTTAQTISTDQAAPTTLGNWVVVASNLISLQGDSIRNDSGRTIGTMHGTIGLHPQVDGGGGVRLIELTSERSLNDVTYTINDQLRPIFTTNNSETYNTKESYLTEFLSGEYVRFIAYADGSLSLAPSSALFRNVSVNGPAALWILHEI